MEPGQLSRFCDAARIPNPTKPESFIPNDMRNLTSIVALSIALSGWLSAQETSIDLSAYLGDMSARQIGPALMSGRVIDLEAHPTNPRIFYVGSAGGGVWKTQDGGISFNPIFDDHCQSIGAIEVDPSDPDNTIYVGTGEIWTRNSVSIGDGLYKSVDGGSNWNKLGFEDSERIAGIIVNPNNPQEVYVGVLGALWSDSEERGVYKSTDGGASFTKILYVDQTTGCADLAMDPNDPNVLYASMWEFRRTAWSFNSGAKRVHCTNPQTEEAAGRRSTMGFRRASWAAWALLLHPRIQTYSTRS